MTVCAIGELSLGEAIAMLASPKSRTVAVTDSPVDASEVFVESFLRAAATERPVRCTAQIVGRVEFRAGEGPLFEIGMRAVVVETTWADALFSWPDGDGLETAAMPLSSLSRYIVEGASFSAVEAPGAARGAPFVAASGSPHTMVSATPSFNKKKLASDRHSLMSSHRGPAVKPTEKIPQVRLVRRSPSHCRVVIEHPPLNLMGATFVVEIGKILIELEADLKVKVVVFESAVKGFFLNHSDFLAEISELTGLPQGPTGLEAWPDILVRLTRAPFVSIALIRGRATGNGSALALACDMSFASREEAILSQWEVGAGLVAGGGPMARLPRLIGRGRALEVLMSSEDIRGDLAEAYGYVNRSFPDEELDAFVDALAERIATFDRWAIANTKRLVNAASLPPDVEIAAGWEACMTSVKRPAAQERIRMLLDGGFQKPGDVEDALGYSLGKLSA